ncbi:MAG: hypothetical protein AVDCRST_MAG86-3546, partial [uncultured Truepera sp.]
MLPQRTQATAGKGGRLTHLADEDLLAAGAGGDAGALAALYARHSRAAY